MDFVSTRVPTHNSNISEGAKNENPVFLIWTLKWIWWLNQSNDWTALNWSPWTGLADYSGVQLQGCCSQSSLNSNGSLPGGGSHRGVPEQRVASWATCFERLLQDPVGVRYFTVGKVFFKWQNVQKRIRLTRQKLCSSGVQCCLHTFDA